MMIFANVASVAKAVPKEWMASFLLILSPFAPHLAEELWARLGHEGSLAYAPWPSFDPKKLVLDEVTLAVQVNGKMRGRVTVPADVSKEDALAAAKADENVARHLEGKEMRREIYVPGRLVNLVVSG
jgi:leucyl-tRNA synthetase